MDGIYFDYNATTPLDSQVREAMLPLLGEIYGNPSSLHRVGQRARAVLDEAHERVARVLGCQPTEIVFTSGGTEANNLALFGVARRLRAKGRHLITSSVEHPAVLNCFRFLAESEGFEVTYLPVNPIGSVAVESLSEALRSDTVLVSIMAANNEIGTVQPVAEMGALCQARGVVFHTDAAQWLGKEPFGSIHSFNADLVSICAHKFHGPKGAGALYVRSGVPLDPLHFGGSHENERRAGTENLAAIVGLTEALERFVPQPVFPREKLHRFSERLAVFLRSLPGVSVHGSRMSCLSNTVAFSVAGCTSLSLLASLDIEGICASSGSACASGSLQPSHVLLAMGVDPSLTRSLIRFSLGRESTLTELETVEAILPGLIQRIRSHQ